jgi:hypothetical protein
MATSVLKTLSGEHEPAAWTRGAYTGVIPASERSQMLQRLVRLPSVSLSVLPPTVSIAVSEVSRGHCAP